jgi:hypothetical protein
MKMKVIVLLIVCFLLNFFLSAKQIPVVNEQCLIHKVSYDHGKKLDSVLLQKIVFNAQIKPVLEMEYSDDGLSIEYKKEYSYKNHRLTSVAIKDKDGESEKTLYTYTSSGLLSKTHYYNNDKLSMVKLYSYEGAKLRTITDYEYVGKKAKLVSKEIRVYNKANKIIKEAVINSGGDTTFKGIYFYDNPGIITYKAYGSDNRELESYQSFFINDSIITNKIFYRGDSSNLKEIYLYDSLQRLIKKELRDRDEKILKTEEYLYTSVGGLRKVIKNNYKEDRKEVIEYEKKGRIITEEFWQGDNVEVKLYYQYSYLK